MHARGELRFVFDELWFGWRTVVRELWFVPNCGSRLVVRLRQQLASLLDRPLADSDEFGKLGCCRYSTGHQHGDEARSWVLDIC
jgi:hypothetical protein